jgi:murein DD-endopeptidase MepM/ murein hydrolase activator NlpD
MTGLVRSTLLTLLCGATLLAAAGCRHVATSATFQPDPSLDYSLGWFHEVERGETLASIGAYYSRGVPLLVQINDLEPPYHLHEKMHLYIPPEDNDGILGNPVMTLDRIRLARAYHDRRVGLPDDAGDVPRKFAEQAKVVTEQMPPSSPSADPSGRFTTYTRPAAAKTKVPTADQVAAARTASAASASAKAVKTSAAVGARPQPLTVAPSKKAGRPLLMPLKADFRVARPFVADGLTTAHVGVDLACPQGTPIFAATDGVVLNSGEFGSYGNMVLIDHGDGFASLYGHNSVNVVHEGDHIKAGQPIARVGQTGRATGPHLHFELRYNGVAVDPAPYLPSLTATVRTTLASSKKSK